MSRHEHGEEQLELGVKCWSSKGKAVMGWDEQGLRCRREGAGGTEDRCDLQLLQLIHKKGIS